MGFLDSKYKRKSMLVTVLIHTGIILLLLFVFGLKYMDPPVESGIAVNFGTSDVGRGEVQSSQPVSSAPEERRQEVVALPQQPVDDEVITQDVEKAPVIPIKEETKPKFAEPTISDNEREPIKQEPRPDKSTTDALSSLINSPKSDGVDTAAEGNDQQGADKGNQDGDPNASAYYGTGKGLDGDGNYLLGGRRALNKKKYLQDCNEAGVVVVSIEVDRSGKVISAVPGVRGTTNNSRCLLEPAKRAALATFFNSDPEAPSKQIGKIIYRFRLSE